MTELKNLRQEYNIWHYQVKKESVTGHLLSSQRSKKKKNEKEWRKCKGFMELAFIKLINTTKV